jgi:hypothetical protein
MTLDKLPSIIRNTEFDEKGCARTESGPLVPAYVASQLGFSIPGKQQLNIFYGRLRQEARVLPLCPFTACAEYLDFSKLERLRSMDEVLGFWNDFNKIVGPVNYGVLMPKSMLMIAILDGGHALDDGVCAEIGHYATEYKGQKPIIGIRSDFRLSENFSAPINPAVRFFLDQGPYKGEFFTGPDAYDKALDSIAGMTKKIIES